MNAIILFGRMRAVVGTAEEAKAVEAAANAAHAQKIEEERHRRYLNQHPRGGYAKAVRHPWVPDADPVAVQTGRRCLPPENDRD